MANGITRFFQATNLSCNAYLFTLPNAVNLSVVGMPLGVASALTPSSHNGPGATILTLTTSSNTPLGTSPITITASSGPLMRSSVVNLVVAQASPAEMTYPNQTSTLAPGANVEFSWKPGPGFVQNQLAVTSLDGTMNYPVVLTGIRQTATVTTPNATIAIRATLRTLISETWVPRIYDYQVAPRPTTAGTESSTTKCGYSSQL